MNEKEQKALVSATTEKLTSNPQLAMLIQQYNDKKIAISTIATNLKLSAGFVKLYLIAGIPFLAYNPEILNVLGLEKILAKAKIEIADFTMEKWVYSEVQPKVVIDWTIGMKCKFSNSHGQQNENCIYSVVWLNDGFVLVLPIENFKVDEIGKKLDSPRILSKLVASNMKPRFPNAEGVYPEVEIVAAGVTPE